MAFEDPIVIDTSGTTEEILPVTATNNLDRISLKNETAIYRLRDKPSTTVTISHQEKAKRRSLFRIDYKTVFDPATDATNAALFPGGANCAMYLVVDVPAGYPTTRVASGIKQLVSYLNASVSTRDQFSRGEY